MIPLTTDVRLKRGIPPAVTGIIVGTLILHVAVQACIDFQWVDPDFRWKWMTFQFEDPNPFDWILSLFSHANYGHWFGNMVFLWIFGSILEDRIGSIKFLLLFLLSGLSADALQMGIYSFFLYLLHMPISDYHMKSLGASGAIAGIMGLTMSRFYKAKVLLLIQYNLLMWKRWAIPIWVFCGYTLLRDLIGIFSGDNVAHLSHIGGFFGGLAAARFLGLKKESQEEIHMERAMLFRESKMFPEAAEAFREVLALNPKNVTAHQELGYCYWGMHNPSKTTDPYLDKARVHFTQALELYLKQENYHDATVLFEKLMKLFKMSDFPEKIPLLLKAHQDKDGRSRVLLTDDPLERRRILEENLKVQYHRGVYQSAHATLQELLVLVEPAQLEIPLLEMAVEVCARIKDHAGEEIFFEQLAKKGDERQIVRAMSVLSRTWLRTPKQLQLNVLYKRAQERLPRLNAYNVWVKLGEELKN